MIFKLVLFFVVGLCLLSVASATDLERLIISSNGHYLENESGIPFLWVGGAYWNMAQIASRSEVEYLFDEITNESHRYNVMFVSMAMNHISTKEISDSNDYK